MSKRTVTDSSGPHGPHETPTPTTHSDAMARLMACPALPRGERGGTVSAHANPRLWKDYVLSSMNVGSAGTEAEGRATWRKWAAPLRRAREERRKWKERARGFADELDVEKEEHAGTRLEWEWCADELEARDVGDALLSFFTDLAILVRKTPAPCPFCAQEVAEDSMSVTCVMCGAYGPEGNFDDVQMWNRVAITAAFARLKDGE